MTDLTKITTPFGLLDAETQDAMMAHGGPYEVYAESGWGGCVYLISAYGPTETLRVKPSPPKPREAWSYGAHLHETREKAEAFRTAIDTDYPGKGYGDGPITHWREVME